jgi:hypothetical protein
MSNFISLFQEKFYYYKNIILSFPIITDKQYVNNNFELITIQKDYLSERKYLDNYLSSDKLKEHIIKSSIERLGGSFRASTSVDENIYLTINNYPYKGPNNLKSYIIWFLDNKKYDNKYIELLLLKKYLINKTQNDYIIFQNPNTLKTVKNIEHCHLLLRKNNGSKSPIINMKLKKLIILARHGPREPLIFPPKLDISMWKNNREDYRTQVYGAKLTELGKIYSKLAGDELMNGYKNNIKFDKLREQDIFIGSTNFERTITTTEYYLLGIGLKTNFTLHILEEIGLLDKYYNRLHELEKIINVDFDKYFINDFNIQIKEIFGIEIMNGKDYFKLDSVINIYKIHKIPLPDEWTPTLDLQLKDITTNYYNKLFENEISSLLVDKLLDKIILLLKDEKIKFSFLCSHDVILMALVKSLQPNIVYKLPDFCSLIRFELWTSTLEDDIHSSNNLIRIYYDSLIIKEIIFN